MVTSGDRRVDRAGCDRADVELVERVRRGDLAALEPLHDRHRAGCERFARRLVGPSDAEDVVSEAFLAMVAAIERGHGPRTSVRAYLHQAIWTAAARRWKRCDEPTDEVVELSPRAPVAPCGRDLDRLDDRVGLAPAMASLPPHWRRVLWLVEVEGRSMAEIGAELTIAPSAAAALAYRARKALRSAYLATAADHDRQEALGAAA
jgi:RNA polymerase sigma factor (sigma-70 family)